MGWVSLYLKWGSNNHFKGCREDQRRIMYMEMLRQLSASYMHCSEKGTENPLQTHIPQPTSSPEFMVLSSQSR